MKIKWVRWPQKALLERYDEIRELTDKTNCEDLMY